ncbi:MAG: hypothetical protein KAZ88_06890 [Acidimicrobiia bacterium]|nr:hypothetical protein [Acidimicrobiia bacterium]
MSKRDSNESEDWEQPLSRAERRRRSRSQRILRGDSRKSGRSQDDRGVIEEPNSALNVIGPFDGPTTGSPSVRIRRSSTPGRDDYADGYVEADDEDLSGELWADTSGDHRAVDEADWASESAIDERFGTGEIETPDTDPWSRRSRRRSAPEQADSEADADPLSERAGAYDEFESSDDVAAGRSKRRRRRGSQGAGDASGPLDRPADPADRGRAGRGESSDDDEGWGDSWIESTWSDDDGDRQWTAPRSEVWDATVDGRDALSAVDDTYSDDLGFLDNDDPAPRSAKKRSGGLFGRRRRPGKATGTGSDRRFATQDPAADPGAPSGASDYYEYDDESDDESDGQAALRDEHREGGTRRDDRGRDSNASRVDDTGRLDDELDPQDDGSEVRRWSQEARARIAAADSARRADDEASRAEAAKRGRPGGFDDFLHSESLQESAASGDIDDGARDEGSQPAGVPDGFWSGAESPRGSGADFSDLSDVADLGSHSELFDTADGAAVDAQPGTGTDRTAAFDRDDVAASGASDTSRDADRESSRRGKRGFRFGRGRAEDGSGSPKAASSRGGWGFESDEIDDSEVLEAEILEGSLLEDEVYADHDDFDPDLEDAELEDHFDRLSDDDVEDANVVEPVASGASPDSGKPSAAPAPESDANDPSGGDNPRSIDRDAANADDDDDLDDEVALDALMITDDELFSDVDEADEWVDADWDDTGEQRFTAESLDSLFDGDNDSTDSSASSADGPPAGGAALPTKEAGEAKGLLGRFRGRRKSKAPDAGRQDDRFADVPNKSADGDGYAGDGGHDQTFGADVPFGTDVPGSGGSAGWDEPSSTESDSSEPEGDEPNERSSDQWGAGGLAAAGAAGVAASADFEDSDPGGLLDDIDFLDEVAAIVDDGSGDPIDLDAEDSLIAPRAQSNSGAAWPGAFSSVADDGDNASDDPDSDNASDDTDTDTASEDARDPSGAIAAASGPAAGASAAFSQPIVGADELASDEDLLGGVHQGVTESAASLYDDDVIDVGDHTGQTSASWPTGPSRSGAASGAGRARSARPRSPQWPEIPRRQTSKRWPTVGKTSGDPFTVPGRQGGQAAWWTDNPDAAAAGSQVLVKATPDQGATRKDEGLIPSRLTEPGPTDWFRTGLTVMIAWLISLAIMGVAMLAIDQFRSYTVLPLAIMMTAGVMRFWRPFELPGALGPIHPATIAVILFTTVIVLFNATYVSEHVINDRQPGATLAAGRWLVDHPSIHEANNPGPFASVAGASSYAFEHVADDDGTITVDFAHVMPVYLAVGGWINDLVPFVADDFFVLWTAPFLSAIGLLAFYALASRLMRAWYAAAATAALAVNMIFMVMSRDVYHEMPAFVFMMAGLWLIVDARAFASIAVLDPAAYGEQRSKLWIPIRPSRWIVAGLCVGAVAMTGVDGLMILAPVALYAAFEWARSSDKAQVQLIDASRPIQPTAEQQTVSRGLPQFLGGVFVSVAAGWFLDGVIVSPAFLSEHSDRIVMLFVVGLLGAGGALLVRLAWRSIAARNRMSSASKDRLGWLAFGLVVFTLIVGYTVWPSIGDTQGSDEPYIERLQCNDRGFEYQLDSGICVDQTTGQPVEVDGTDRYRSYGLRWVGWYIVESTLVLGGLGLAFAVRETVRGRARSTLPLVLFFVPISLLSLSRANGWPDQPWVMRQFMPLVIPGFLLFAFWFVERLVRRGPDGKWPQALAYVGYLGALVAIAVPAFYLVPVWEAREDSRGLREMHLVCEAVEGGAVAVVRDTPEILGPGVHHDLIPSLRGFCNVPVSSVSPELTEDNWTALANAWAGKNKRLYVVGRSFETILTTAPQAKNVLQWRTEAQRAAAEGAEPFVQITNAVEMEWTVERRPKATVVNPYDFAIARVDLPKPAATPPANNSQNPTQNGLPQGGIPGSGVTGGITSNGLTTGGVSTTGGVTTAGVTAGGVTTNGLTAGGLTTNGLTTGGLDGSTTGGLTTTAGGTTLGGLTGGATTGGLTAGSVTGGATLTGGATTGGVTTGGVTTGGATLTGGATTGADPAATTGATPTTVVGAPTTVAP